MPGDDENVAAALQEHSQLKGELKNQQDKYEVVLKELNTVKSQLAEKQKDESEKSAEDESPIPKINHQSSIM